MMYHWICTVQVYSPGKVKAGYQAGCYEPVPGETRGAIFGKLFDQAVKTVWRPGDSDPVPLFFSLEPMQLDGQHDKRKP